MTLSGGLCRSLSGNRHEGRKDRTMGYLGQLRVSEGVKLPVAGKAGDGCDIGHVLRGTWRLSNRQMEIAGWFHSADALAHLRSTSLFTSVF